MVGGGKKELGVVLEICLANIIFAGFKTMHFAFQENRPKILDLYKEYAKTSTLIYRVSGLKVSKSDSLFLWSNSLELKNYLYRKIISPSFNVNRC